MHASFRSALISICIISALNTLTGCGGGGGAASGGSVPSTNAGAQTIVSGTVQAPGGAIAFYKNSTVGDWFESEAYAVVGGLSSVPDGTKVELGRVGISSPFGFSPLAATTTSGGRYTFNLTSLGLSPSVDLVIRASNGTTEMRAFVTGTAIDLSPMSETAFLLATHELGSSQITQYTLQELADITGAIILIANLESISFTARTLPQAVSAISSAVQTKADIVNFISSAATAGQTPQGPGDIGELYPLSDGNVWKYDGVLHDNGSSSTFANRLMVSGTTTLTGSPATILLETNPEGGARSEEHYLFKDSTGLLRRGSNDTSDFISPQILPYYEMRFPLAPNSTYEQINHSGINLGIDLDADGTNESANVLLIMKTLGFESVSVPAGNYPTTLKTETTLTLTIIFSTDQSTATVEERDTAWYAPHVGPVMRTSAIDGSETRIERLTEFVGGLKYSHIATGLTTCARTLSGQGQCWGYNVYGETGTGDSLTSPFKRDPTATNGNLNFESIFDRCGITTLHQTFCWGRNDSGQLGNNSLVDSNTPVLVSGGFAFSSITTGSGFRCGLTSGGTAYCWGLNHKGMLGNGSLTNSLVPVPVEGGKTFSSISAGSSHTCAVDSTGKAYCWGDNQFGQLGNGITTDSSVPAPVLGGLVFRSIAAGFATTCALTTGGAVYCWGLNDGGQFGNGTSTFSSSTPVASASGMSFVSLSGHQHYCGLTATGSAYCWGRNYAGALGNGSSVNSINIPTAVSGGLLFSQISAKMGTCGITTDGAAYCWGSNDSGQLGNPTYPEASVPIRVYPPN